MKLLRKVLVALLVLLLSACSASGDIPQENPTQNEDVVLQDVSYYLNALENYVSRDKDKTNVSDNEQFDKFLDDSFVEYLESDYIEMRAFVLDYAKYGVTKPAVTWGNFTYQNTDKAKYYQTKLNELSTFDYNSLSYDQQFEYEKYEYYLYENICSELFKEYQLLFSYSYDLLDYVFFNLDEFTLNSKEYVDDYLVLLKDSSRYFDEALTFTGKQALNGIYTPNESIDYTYEYAIELIGDEQNNDFINSFNKRIDKVDFLTDEEKQQYKEQNEKIVKEDVIPSLEKVRDTIITYYDKASSEDLLTCNISKDYARFVVMLNSSSNDSVDDLFNDCLEQLLLISDKYQAAKASEEVIDEYANVYTEYEQFKLDDVETIEYLANIIKEFVPELGDVHYEISRLDAASDASSTIAYHLQPTVDNPDGTVIRTNPNNMGSDVIDDFVVIAHEGLPGHMYQNLYYMQTNPSDLCSVFRYIGYKEGWATYSMFEALRHAGIKDTGVNDIVEFSWLVNYYLCTLGDIYYNYYGHSIEEFEEFLSSYGYKSTMAQSIYDVVIKNSGTNEQYGLGYMKFIMLRNKAESELGDKFDPVAFHDELIKHGTLPIVVLEKAIDDYIAENK